MAPLGPSDEFMTSATYRHLELRVEMYLREGTWSTDPGGLRFILSELTWCLRLPRQISARGESVSASPSDSCIERPWYRRLCMPSSPWQTAPGGASIAVGGRVCREEDKLNAAALGPTRSPDGVGNLSGAVVRVRRGQPSTALDDSGEVFEGSDPETTAGAAVCVDSGGRGDVCESF
ncbi:hypothetical protein K466DRAFT_605889 [Polyporus arcularius HHB13444]|uniref:Uncharacterized protein n=1 Tax=Polyporus arcularius HHB13444 TaxID=1314778 RepID=A0A5C3NQV1_9APHY|nr:hypothetical protein K466DRAFT_605889 [Polyporus arcularius HHB13444]